LRDSSDQRVPPPQHKRFCALFPTRHASFHVTWENVGWGKNRSVENEFKRQRMTPGKQQLTFRDFDVIKTIALALAIKDEYGVYNLPNG